MFKVKRVQGIVFQLKKVEKPEGIHSIMIWGREKQELLLALIL